MARNDTQERRQRLAMMKQERRQDEDYWWEIQDFTDPFRSRMLSDEFDSPIWDVRDRNTQVYDTTGMTSLRDIMNWLKGRIWPADADWMQFGLPIAFQKEFGEDVELARMYDQAGMEVQQDMSESNFFIESIAGATDLLNIGNECTIQEEAPAARGKDTTYGGVEYESIPMDRVWWQLDRQRRPIHIAVRYDIPAREAMDRFDDPEGALSDVAIVRNRPMELVTIIHWVWKNENHIPGGLRAKSNKKWISAWDTVGRKYANVEMGGLDAHPYSTSVFAKTGGSGYGHGLGHLSFPDIAGINAAKSQIWLALGRDLNPRLMVEHGHLLGSSDPGPGGTIILKRSKSDRPSYLTSETSYPEAYRIIEADQARVREVYLGDVIKDPESADRSAEATLDRQSRGSVRLSSFTEIMDHSFLRPKVINHARIMHKRGSLKILDEIADRIGEPRFELTFVSPLFALQRRQNAEAIIAYASVLSRLAAETGKIEIMDNADMDVAAQEIARLGGVPPKVVTTQQQRFQTRLARARQAARANQAERAAGRGTAEQAPAPQPQEATA